MNFVPAEDIIGAIGSMKCGSVVSSATEIRFVSLPEFSGVVCGTLVSAAAFSVSGGALVLVIADLVSSRLALVSSSSASRVNG